MTGTVVSVTTSATADANTVTVQPDGGPPPPPPVTYTNVKDRLASKCELALIHGLKVTIPDETLDNPPSVKLHK